MQMRHVSVFRVKNECRNPEVIEHLAELLRALPAQIPTITACEVGIKPYPMPTAAPDGAVQFYDLIQIISFANEDDCDEYPATDGHMNFLTESQPYMDQVVALDYPVE